MPETEPLRKQNYISLETYRKTGEAVRTPVWFANSESDRQIYVMTEISSGKVKRIRNNPNVKLAPSNSSGIPRGEFIPATARITEKDTSDFKEGIQRINKKYGLVKIVYDFFSGNKKPLCVLIIRMTE